MVFLKDWEDFEIAAESMYLQNPANCRYSMKYVHSKGQLLLKLSDNVKVFAFVYHNRLKELLCLSSNSVFSAFNTRAKSCQT